jgi:hypothetical protein
MHERHAGDEMKVTWYRVRRTYPKPQGGFVAHNVRYPGVLSDDGTDVLFVHHGDPRWHEVVPIEHLEESPEEAPHRRRGRK